MRTGLLGPATALWAAAHLAPATAAAQAPESAPPPLVAAPAVLPELTSSGQPAADAPAGPRSEPSATTPPQAQAQSAATNAIANAQTTAGAPAFRDDHCGPPQRGWLGGGPVLWWLKDGPLRATLATSATGQLGGEGLDYGTLAGGEVHGGLWLDRRHVFGVEFSGFLLEQRSASGALFSDAAGVPVIGRPIIDVITLNPIDVLAASPGALAGGVAFASSSRLAGAEAGFVRNLFYDCDCTVDVGFGFRYLDLDEDLTITQATAALAGGRIPLNGVAVPGVVLEDRFNTRNQFYGGQLSGRAEYRIGPAFLGLAAKVALGPNHEVIEISGSTRAPDGAALSGGLLAVAGGNIGRQVTNRFVVVPEVGARVGCQLTSLVRVSAGYTFLYINDVSRPGSQIDTAVNPRLVPLSQAFGSVSGPATPRVTGFSDDFYAHGVQFTLEVTY